MPGFSGKTLSDFCPSAERGDHGIDFWGLHTFLFLLTPLGGGDPSRTSTIWPPSRFLLTPQRRGVIQRRRGGHRRLLGISTHAPGRGRSQRLFEADRRPYYFYSRPRAGGDHKVASSTKISQSISTHAPGRGAIQYKQFQRLQREISTHAPGRGAIVRGETDAPGEKISTHAPGRGRSVRRRVPWLVCLNFYSRPRAGAILRGSPPLTWWCQYFYSRPRAGAIGHLCQAGLCPHYFYSRPRAGAIPRRAWRRW